MQRINKIIFVVVLMAITFVLFKIGGWVLAILMLILTIKAIIAFTAQTEKQDNVKKRKKENKPDDEQIEYPNPHLINAFKPDNTADYIVYIIGLVLVICVTMYSLS
jgi:c-di-AMP phosphodiesterase-like protein